MKAKECIDMVKKAIEKIELSDNTTDFQEAVVDILVDTIETLEDLTEFIGDSDNFEHKEIADERITNVDLAYILSNGYGEVLDEENQMRMTFWCYSCEDAYSPVPDGFKVRKWGCPFVEPTESFYYEFLNWLDRRYPV